MQLFWPWEERTWVLMREDMGQPGPGCNCQWCPVKSYSLWTLTKFTVVIHLSSRDLSIHPSSQLFFVCCFGALHCLEPWLWLFWSEWWGGGKAERPEHNLIMEVDVIFSIAGEVSYNLWEWRKWLLLFVVYRERRGNFAEEVTLKLNFEEWVYIL